MIHIQWWVLLIYFIVFIFLDRLLSDVFKKIKKDKDKCLSCGKKNKEKSGFIWIDINGRKEFYCLDCFNKKAEEKNISYIQFAGRAKRLNSKKN